MSISDPYQWQESVLSTRSLSYASTLDLLEAAIAAGPRPPMRNDTMTSVDEDAPSSTTPNPLLDDPFERDHAMVAGIYQRSA